MLETLEEILESLTLKEYLTKWDRLKAWYIMEMMRLMLSLEDTRMLIMQLGNLMDTVLREEEFW